MSPIAARAAFRAATRGAVQQKMQFSVMRTMRNMARSFEPHPFQRLPEVSDVQAADWGRQMRRVGKQAAIYFPGLTILLGWPYLAAKTIDGHM